MESKTYKFKTNINCGGCIKAVKPHLDAAQGVTSWEVDTDVPEKILSVSVRGATPQQVMQAVEKAGFKIQPFVAGT